MKFMLFFHLSISWRSLPETIWQAAPSPHRTAIRLLAALRSGPQDIGHKFPGKTSKFLAFIFLDIVLTHQSSYRSSLPIPVNTAG